MPSLIYDDGSSCFRLKILLAALTNRPICIKNIRNRSKAPGVTAAEIDFLKLISEISNGAVIRINDTGCIVNFSPGTLIGGDVTFSCSPERGLGYYLEPLLILSPFTKKPMSLTLIGATNNIIDPSVDVISHSWLPFIKKFLPVATASGLRLDIKKRGLPPKGGGEIYFSSKPAQQISPVQMIGTGKFYRIRGVAWTCRVSPGIASQIIHGAKELLNSVLSDVYINLDQRKRDVAGNSSGFGLVLWAESKEGAIFSAEATSKPAEDGDTPRAAPSIPSELGHLAASRLLDQIYYGGYVDHSLQSLALTLMALEGGRNASQLLISAPTPYTVESLRLIRQSLGVIFDLTYNEKSHVTSERGDGDEIDEDKKDDERPPPLLATCFGSGIRNINLSVR